MKKYILTALLILSFTTVNSAMARNLTPNSALSSAIKQYKSGNYTQAYQIFVNLSKADPSNAVVYYYLAMSSAQVGRKDEALEYYDKVISLTNSRKLKFYATKGKTCLESPEECSAMKFTDEYEDFINSKKGFNFSDEARSDYEQKKIDNIRREINRSNDITPQKFREYRDFSSMNNENPTNEEIVAALRTLQNAGFSNLINNNIDLSMINGNTNDMLNSSLLGNSNSKDLNPQIIQSLLRNQMNFGF